MEPIVWIVVKSFEILLDLKRMETEIRLFGVLMHKLKKSCLVVYLSPTYDPSPFSHMASIIICL